MLCREANVSQALTSCGHILRQDPPSVQPFNDNDQPVQLPLSLHHSLLFKLMLTTRQRLHAVNTPKCTYTHTLLYFQTRIHTHTYRNKVSTYMCANTRASLQSTVCVNQTIISHLFSALQALFCLPPPPLLLAVLFKSAHLPVVCESAS